MTRWLETDTLSNQNISSAAVIGAYTADADRLIICDVQIDQAAGNGDYVLYITKQIGGAGSSYVVLPKTTGAAASGETAIAVQSGLIPVRSGDILTVYVDGLAGDTTTPDTIVRWFELAALRPATADRTIAVDASGQVTTGALAAGAITAAAIATDAITAAKISDGAIDAATFVAGAINAAAIAADASLEISDAVWDELLAGHAIAGSAGAALSSGSVDPLLNAVPGSYLAGTAGNALGRIGSGQIEVRSIVANSGAVETIRGDSYLNTDGRRIEWTEVQSGGTWPTLTGATIKVKIGGAVEFDGVVITATGTSKKVGVELTATQSATIPTNTNPGHDFSVVATLTNGSIVTLVTTKRPDAADEVSTPKWTSIEQIVLGE